MEDLRLRGNLNKAMSIVKKSMGKRSFSAFASLVNEIKPVFRDSRFRRIVWLGAINITCLSLLLSWCNATKSLSLLSYTYLIIFDILCLCICALSIWVEQKKPNSHYTFGYDRFEVLAIFMATTFSCICSIFAVKKSISKWIQQTHIHTGRFFPGIVVAFLCHMLITYCMKNKGLNLVVCASNSSWLQNRVTALSQSLCHIVPGLGSTVLPRLNPFSLLGWIAGGTLLIAQFFIDIYDYHSADSIAAIFIAVMICITMYPMSAYSGKILLQGTPLHVADLLDKCLREVSTLDGVLEFRNEHFWLLGFDKIVGTIHVRIRRDANEQVVLSHLLNKLSSLVTDITIQVFKDEWAWSSSTRQILNESFMKFPPVTKSYAPPVSTLNTISSSVKDPLLNIASQSTNALPAMYTNTVPDSSIKTPKEREFPHSYSTIPLPPSLQSSVSSSRNPKMGHYTINMTHPTEVVSPSVGGHTSTSRSYQAVPSASLTFDSGMYSKELRINPQLSPTQDFLKLYKS